MQPITATRRQGDTAGSPELSAGKNNDAQDKSGLPLVYLQAPVLRPDFASILGIFLTIGLIGWAVSMGSGDANFFNLPSLLIVICGTITATAISYTGDELARAWGIFAKSLLRRVQNPASMASSLIDLAVVAKKKGVLALVNYEGELAKDSFLKYAVQMVVDGYEAQEIDRVLTLEIDALTDRHKRSAGIARRAAEIAPAMGLIGTLVGLVQMLADLENPETIGPAMALALLTTFYGAILGTIVMMPLAVKLDKSSSDEALIKNLIRIAAASIARQDNPRRLEMLLNAELPPAVRIQYFD